MQALLPICGQEFCLLDLRVAPASGKVALDRGQAGSVGGAGPCLPRSGPALQRAPF